MPVLYKFFGTVALWAYTSYNVLDDGNEFFDDSFDESESEVYNPVTGEWEKVPEKKKDFLGINDSVSDLGTSIKDSIDDTKKYLIAGGLLYIVLSTKPWK